jgi:hypothetical protein
MSRSRVSLTLALTAILSLAACARHELPVDLKQCDTVTGPQGSSATVKVHNGSDKPVSYVTITLDFYHDFTFSRINGGAIFTPALEPKNDASASVAITNPQDAAGNVQHCVITHVRYADGTTQDADAPPNPTTTTIGN